MLVAIYLWQRDQLQGNGFLVVYGVVLGIPVIWLVVVLIMYLRARGALRGLAPGVAIRIGPPGIEVAGLGAPWPQVASVAAVKPGPGKGPVLRLTLLDGRQAAVPFEHVTVFPGHAGRRRSGVLGQPVRGGPVGAGQLTPTGYPAAAPFARLTPTLRHERIPNHAHRHP